jgi:hypothetical protein
MSSVTQPVPNQQSAMVDVKNKDGKTIGQGFIIPPWNSFFSEFSEAAPAIESELGESPFTANTNGTLIIKGGTGISLERGGVTITLANGQAIIPISDGDTITWATATSVQFLGS